MLHHLNPLRMDSLRFFTSSMHKLLQVAALPLHEMYDNVSSSPPTSMHSQRIGITPSQELGMPILQECFEVKGERDMLSYIS
jgi:hypothetical protein